MSVVCPPYEPKMVPTCVVNPSKPLGVRCLCFMIIHKNIKRVKHGVDLSLDLKLILCGCFEV